MSIEGLGNLAATEWAIDIAKAAEKGEYHLGKLGGYALPALARMFRFCEQTSRYAEIGRDSAAQELQRMLVQHADSLSSLGLFSVAREFRLLHAWHADILLNKWLAAGYDPIVELAATAVGHLRLTRARPRLIDRLKEPGPLASETRRTLLREIGRIGGPQAVDFLVPLAREGDDIARVALVYCLEAAPDQDFEAPAEEGLEAKHPIDRGVAALALARGRGREALERVEVARSESADQMETTLTTPAVVQASDSASVVNDLLAQIAAPLAEDAWQYEPVLFGDVLSVLEGWGGQVGTDLAAVLRWIHNAP